MASKLTLNLFTSKTCSLCTTAYKSLQTVQTKVPFHLNLIDINQPDNKHHFDKYCFDIPVLTIKKQDQHKVIQMHRIDESKLIEALNELNKNNQN